MFVSLLVQFYYNWCNEFPNKKEEKEWSTNSTDIEERKRPHVASSLDDLIVEANNGEMFKKALKSDDCVAIICNCI